MTEFLEQAIERLKLLDSRQQDEIAALIMAELEDESAWDHSFAQSQD